jgi:flagellar biosynthesis chaperone FliJ
MNKDRRKALSQINVQLESIKDQLDGIKQEEQEAFDNLPESLQTGSNGSLMEAAINELDDAINTIEDAVSSINSACE